MARGTCTHVDSVTRSMAATGHAVGTSYVSAETGQVYTVEAMATLWELAPDEAVVVVWSNGNRTITDHPRGADVEVCSRCQSGTSLREWSAA